MLPTVRLSLEAGVSRQRHKRKIIVHYLITTDMVVARFITGFRRTGDIKVPVANPSPKIGASRPIYKQQMFAHYLMVMDMEAALFMVG